MAFPCVTTTAGGEPSRPPPRFATPAVTTLPAVFVPQLPLKLVSKEITASVESTRLDKANVNRQKLGRTAPLHRHLVAGCSK